MPLPTSFLFSLSKDLAAAVIKSFKRKPSQEVLLHRQRIKKQLQVDLGLNPTWRPEHADEVLIRDIDRLDQYPESKVLPDEGKASPFFKTELRGMYHGGIEVYLQVVELWVDGESGAWALADDNSVGNTTAMLVGRIPFDWIVQIDKDWDEYDALTHIYCSFTRKGMPYEDIRIFRIHKKEGRVSRYEELGSYYDRG